MIGLPLGCKMSNRDTKAPLQLGKFWCRCDASLIGKGEICSVCGTKDSSKRRNKH